MADPQTRTIAGLLAWMAAVCLVSGCASSTPPIRPDPGPESHPPAVDPVALLDRVSWGATGSSLQAIRSEGAQQWIAHQLRPPLDPPLPPQVSEQIAALSIQTAPMTEHVIDLERRRRDIDKIADEEARKTARQAWQEEVNRTGRETATRMLLRALYSPNQLQEQMTWFWFNHFNVFQYKNDERPMLADYEQTLRNHALGRFRDLLAAVVRHPAMLIYLDNAQNAKDHINENYARELMELHTLGVDAGYTQRDVIEVARCFTGWSIRDPRLGGGFDFKE